MKDDNNRIINFTGTFEPVTKACRFPLPSGKLCPRKDRYKVSTVISSILEKRTWVKLCFSSIHLQCPLHGPIIPRDEQGVPVDRPVQQGRDDGQTSAPGTLVWGGGGGG